MKKYQPFMEFYAHGKNISTVSKMLWLLDSNISDIYPLAPLVVFEAFTIESYLNYLGMESIEFWNELERLSWQKKVNIIHMHYGRTPDWGREPLQFAKEIFAIRDKLAHGKPEKVHGDLYTDYNSAQKILGTKELDPEWYKKIDRDWALRSRDRFQELMKYLRMVVDKRVSSHQVGGSGGVIEVETT